MATTRVHEPTSIPRSLLLGARMPAQPSIPQSRALASKSMPGAGNREPGPSESPGAHVCLCERETGSLWEHIT